MTKPIPALNTIAIAQAHLDGYNTGKDWPNAWETHGTPGGPFSYDAQTGAERRAWCEGWQLGHADKLRTRSSHAAVDPLAL